MITVFVVISIVIILSFILLAGIRNIIILVDSNTFNSYIGIKALKILLQKNGFDPSNIMDTYYCLDGGCYGVLMHPITFLWFLFAVKKEKRDQIPWKKKGW